MNAVKIIAIALIVVGALGLVFGGVSYTKDRHEMQVGSVSLTMEERGTINMPLWAGMAAIVVGGVLLLVPIKKS